MNSVEKLIVSANNSHTKSLETSLMKANKEKTSYAFIRLYASTFTEKLTFDKILGQSIDFFSEDLEKGESYSHAAMNYRLTDNFFGLNWEFGEKNDVKVETVHNKKPTESEDFPNNKFSVYAIPLSEKEHEKLRVNLESFKGSNQFNYQWLDLALAAFHLTKNKLVNKVHSLFNDEDDYKQTSEASKVITSDEIIIDGKKLTAAEKKLLIYTKKGLVCSTFVVYVLSQVSPDFNTYFKESKKFIQEFSPNTLTTLPGVKLLFKGKWKDYERIAKSFVVKNPEFAKFLK